MTSRKRAIRERVKLLEPLYFNTIEDAIAGRHTQLTEHIPITDDFSLTVTGFPISTHAIDMLETSADAFIDPGGATTAIRIGYDAFNERFVFDGIKAKLKHMDGDMSITKTSGAKNNYILNKPEPSMPDFPLTSVVEPAFIDELFDNLNLDLPAKTSEQDLRDWGKKHLGSQAITGWHLKQSAPLADGLTFAEHGDNIVYGSIALHKEISAKPHRGGLSMSDIRATSHTITLDSGDNTPTRAYKDMILTTSLTDGVTDDVLRNFGIFQQEIIDGVETPLQLQPKTQRMLVKHLKRLDSLLNSKEG